MAVARFKKYLVNFNGTQMRAEDVKVSNKQDMTTKTATNDFEAYGMILGDVTYEIELSGVDSEQRAMFEKIREKQMMQRDTMYSIPSFASYDYTPSGSLRLQHSFTRCFVGDISDSNNEDFDVKITALHRVPLDQR